MLFVILNEDKPGSFELRMSARPKHLVWLEEKVADLVMVGPMLDEEGKPKGSVLIVDKPDLEAARAFAAADPYVEAGLFARSTVSPFRSVYKDGAKVG